MDKTVIISTNALKLVNKDSKPDADGMVKVEGYACHFGKANGNSEIVDEKSFRAFFKELKARNQMPYFNYNHQNGAIVGGWDKIESDEVGLRVVGHLNTNVALVRDTVLPLIESGDLVGLSTEGFVPWSKIEERENGEYYCGEFILVGISIVPMAADNDARINVMNTLRDGFNAFRAENKPKISIKTDAMKKEQIKERLEALKNSLDAVADSNPEAHNDISVKINELVSEFNKEQEEVDAEKVKNQLSAIEEMLKAVNEKNEIGKQKPKPMNENYLAGKNAVHDFAQALRSENFAKNWNARLSENGITITGGDEFGYMPDYVKGRIQDLVKKSFPWLQMLNYVNAKAYVIRTEETDMDSSNPDNLGKGHKKGETKAENAYALVAAELNAKPIYTLIYVDNIDDYNDEGLIDYVLDRLIRDLNAGIAKAVLIGDGRSSGTPDKRISSISAIARSTTDSFVTVSTHSAGAELITEARALTDAISNDDGGDIILLASKADITEMETVKFGTNSSTQYQSKEQLAGQLGVSAIFDSSWLGSDKTYRMIAFVPSKYIMIGDRDAMGVKTWEVYETNKQGFRGEVYKAGAVEGLKSASVLKA